MKIGIIGAGNIGGNLARLLVGAGHEVQVSFSRDPAGLARLAANIGAAAATSAQAAAFAEVVVISVPWGVFDQAITEAGGAAAFAGKVVIDTTNQFERVDGALAVLDLGESSAARQHAVAVPGARWSKAFNTLTAGFQAASSGRTGPDRVVMFYAADDDDTATVVAQVINDAGFDPVRTGTLDRTEVGHQEPKGDLYGEEFQHDQALTMVEKLRGTPPSGTGRP